MKSEEPIVKTKRILCSLLAILPWMPRIASAGLLPPVPPVKYPFDASRAGSALDEEFRVVEYRAYYFDLRFEFVGEDDLDRVAKLVGRGATYSDGRYATPGVIVPVQLKIVRIGVKSDTGVLFDKTVESQGIYSVGYTGQKLNGDFRRRVATVQLKPGLYRFQAMTLKDVPEFIGTPSHFAISFNPKIVYPQE